MNTITNILFIEGKYWIEVDGKARLSVGPLCPPDLFVGDKVSIHIVKEPRCDRAQPATAQPQP